MTRKKQQPSPALNFIKLRGAQGLTFLAALAALIGAYFLPHYRNEILGASGALVLAAISYQEEEDKIGFKPLGFLAAGVALFAVFFMPDQAETLLRASGAICLGTILLL
jgi:hypothetical protein